MVLFIWKGLNKSPIEVNTAETSIALQQNSLIRMIGSQCGFHNAGLPRKMHRESLIHWIVSKLIVSVARFFLSGRFVYHLLQNLNFRSNAICLSSEFPDWSRLSYSRDIEMFIAQKSVEPDSIWLATNCHSIDSHHFRLKSAQSSFKVKSLSETKRSK